MEKQYNTQEVDISKVRENENNPRYITDDKFEQLKKSISEFPEMLRLRPIIVDENMVVLGGNMRLRACRELGMEKIPVVQASQLSPDEQKRFIIVDNVGFGRWDWDMLANEWDSNELGDWGLEVWQPDETPEYEDLEDEDLEDEVEEMKDGLKKAIMIEFEPEHYEEAFELVKFWRDQSGDVGAMILEFLRREKEKL